MDLENENRKALIDRKYADLQKKYDKLISTHMDLIERFDELNNECHEKYREISYLRSRVNELTSEIFSMMDETDDETDDK